MEIIKLTNNQYEILVRIEDDYWCYPFSHFDELKLTRKELSKEFKILREAGLVEFHNGLMSEEYGVAGSGYCRASGKNDEIDKLIEDWEEENLPTYEEFIAGKKG